MTSRAALCLVLLAAPLGCERPFVLLPGGAIDGTPRPAPASWAFTDDVKTVLEFA